MARILILTLVFPPDGVSTAQIMGDLARGLKEAGDDVTVLTTVPHYNQDMEAEQQQPIGRLWGPVLRKSNYHGIPVYHTFMPRKGANILLRMVAWTGFHLISTLAGSVVTRKPDVVLAPSPPLTIGLSAWMLGRFHRAPYIYNVKELYPDLAINLGALRNTHLIRLMRLLERFVYRKASAITVIAPRMREVILQRGVGPHKVSVIPDSVDTDNLRPLPKDNDFTRQHKIHNKFVVSYAGNMGPAQGLASFIEAAHLLRDETDIHFLMMGNGILREKLERQVMRLNLSNFTFLPYQSYASMPQIYAGSDLNLVPLVGGLDADAIPSKVYSIMAAERAMVASTNIDSDLARIVGEVGCGWVVPPGDVQALASTIKQAYDQQPAMRQMGQRGRAYVLTHNSRQAVVQQYRDLISKLLTAPKQPCIRQ